MKHRGEIKALRRVNQTQGLSGDVGDSKGRRALLEAQIKQSAHSLATDAYDMSVGELINIYRDDELVVSPEFQRLFRWTKFQKSHLIESLLIGVPIPSIFVFELEDGKWELIDGLQRVSTILEFVGILKNSDGNLYLPSVLEGTRYLPALEGLSWDGTPLDSIAIGTASQVIIKRSRISMQILRKTSDQKAKYDLFQRLNSHGSVASAQELRNNILYMVNRDMFYLMKAAASDSEFVRIMHQTDRSTEVQGLMDFVTRFMVFMYVEYKKRWDVEEYLDTGIIELAELETDILEGLMTDFKRTLALLVATDEPNILRRYKDRRYQGKVGQAAFETIFLGIGQNVDFVEKKRNSRDYILKKTRELWSRDDVINFTRAGLRGTDRIRQTLPFGEKWFSE